MIFLELSLITLQFCTHFYPFFFEINQFLLQRKVLHTFRQSFISLHNLTPLEFHALNLITHLNKILLFCLRSPSLLLLGFLFFDNFLLQCLVIYIQRTHWFFFLTYRDPPKSSFKTEVVSFELFLHISFFISQCVQRHFIQIMLCYFLKIDVKTFQALI